MAKQIHITFRDGVRATLPGDEDLMNALAYSMETGVKLDFNHNDERIIVAGEHVMMAIHADFADEFEIDDEEGEE